MRQKLVLGGCILAGSALLYYLLSPYLSMEYLDMQRGNYLEYYAQRPVLVFCVYVLLAAALVGLLLPVNGLALLLAGALFGCPVGALAGGIACTLGASFGFLWSRYLVRDLLQHRYKVRLDVINRGVEREGWFYVFSLRLLMVFPYFLVNVLCALTTLRFAVFFGATLCSQLIVATVWAYAGSQLAQIQKTTDLVTPELVFSLALIGLAPLFFKRIVNWARQRQTSDGFN